MAGEVRLAVDVVGVQRFAFFFRGFGFLAPGDLPGAAAPPLVARVAGNKGGARRQSDGAS